MKTKIGGNGRISQCIEREETQRRQHLLNIGMGGAQVSMDKVVSRLKPILRSHEIGYPLFGSGRWG